MWMKQHLDPRLLALAALLLLVAGVTAGPKLHRVFTVFNASDGLADNSAQTIKCTKTGRMVITTIGHVNFYDGDRFNHIDPLPEQMFPLPKYSGHYRLYFDTYHHLWVKDKRIVMCVDLLTERFVTNVDSVIRQLGMPHHVDDQFCDNDNQLWFLSGDKLYGVGKEKPFPVSQRAELHDVAVYHETTLLQFFSNGVVAGYDLKTGRHLFDVPSPKGTMTNVKSSVILPDSNVFYQIRNAEKDAVLLAFDAAARQWHSMMSVPYHLNNMVKERGKLYIASEYGYWEYNPRTGTALHQEELTLKGGRKLKTDINVICFDRQGNMWIGTENRGLLYSRRYKSPFVTFSLESPEAQEYMRKMDALQRANPSDSLPRHINCRFRDSRGWTWTGSYTGLELQRKADGPVTVYNRKDGLLNEMVHSVIEDQSNDIWASTSFGISHLYIRGDSVFHIDTYSIDDNVPVESFVNDRAMMEADGTIVMQSLDHMVAFHPSNFYTSELKHMVLFPKLVRLLVNGHVIQPGTRLDDRVILDRTITRIREFSVNYDQNSISLVFSGLNYLRPIQTYYRVRVKGVYDDWRVYAYADGNGFVDGRGLLHLPLPGLRPGQYQVEVQASMTPDSWPHEPFVWIVNVEEPWWRSTGVYLLLGLLLLAAVVANVVFYSKNTRLRLLRNSQEGDIIRLIRNFISRCDDMQREVLAPHLTSEGDEEVPSDLQDGRFEDAMLKMIPYIRQREGKEITMSALSDVTGIKAGELYGLLSANLYKGPRQMLVRQRLEHASLMLRNTDMPFDEIAEQCGFKTPNYFIACFYHQYRQTPLDYRNSKPL